MSKKKVGLALGGGAVLGAAHIGVLKALEQKGYGVTHITGTSIGAFVAGLYAFGVSVEKLEEIAVDLDWLDITSFKFSQMGILTNKKIGDMICEILGEKNIEDSPIPLAMIATDISAGRKVVMDKGPLHTAVMASTCLPGIFIPVERDDYLLVDGVLCENVPITPLRDLGAIDIIAVDLTTNRSYKRPEDIVDVLSNTFDIGLNNMIKEQIEDDDVLFIQPVLSAYNKADTRKTEQLIEEGYKAAMDILN